MWNAFGNGSSGYVSKAQGWEFVPCPRLERPGKKVQSPARVRSFPSNFLEQLPPGSSDAPSHEHSPHTRLKKKLEDLKKRYDHEKEEWRMEKEMLLRQVADIQVATNTSMRHQWVLTNQQCASLLFCVVFTGWGKQKDIVGPEVCFRRGAVGGEA